jgi:ADP-ribose pyrophosphatase
LAVLNLPVNRELPLPHTSKLIYQGRILQFSIDSLTLPNGKAVELEVLRHPGGAAIVALDEHNQVCLLRQYRHAAGGWLWELPAGKLESGENLYLARDLTAVPAQPEDDELFEVHWIPFEQALEQVHDGTLLDAKTMLGLTLAEKYIRA